MPVHNKRFGEEHVRYDHYKQKGYLPIFPVLLGNGQVSQSNELSQVLQNLPIIAIEFVFISPEYKDNALEWLGKNINEIIKDEVE